MNMTWLAVAATAGLAACASAPVAQPLAGPVAGKWRAVVSVAGMTLPPQDQCVEQPVNLTDFVATPDQDENGCDKPAYTAVVGGFDGIQVCTVDDMTTRHTVRIRGDLSSAYTMELTSETPPAEERGMPGVVRVKMERIGDC